MPVAPSSPVLRLKNVFRHYQMSWGGRGQHCTWLRSILIDAGKKKRDRWINLIMTIKSDFTPTSFCARVCLVAQLCPTLCDSMDCSPPGSSVHEIFQIRILEWVAISYSRGPSQLRIKPASLASPALAGGFFTTVPPGKPKSTICQYKIKIKIKKKHKS